MFMFTKLDVPEFAQISKKNVTLLFVTYNIWPKKLEKIKAYVKANLPTLQNILKKSKSFFIESSSRIFTSNIYTVKPR